MVRVKKQSPLLQYVMLTLQAVLIGLAVYFLVRAVILFVTPQSVWKVSSAPSNNQSVSGSQAQNYTFSFDPFHRDVTPVIVDLGSDAPETTLNLKMVGRRAGDGGSAIILTPDRKQGVYRVGDEIISGVTLKNVTPDYIVLSQNGRLERLTFERTESGLTSAGPKPQSLIPSPSNSTTMTSNSASLSNLMTSVNLERVTKNGNVQGFRIVPRQAGGDLSRFGFQTGDIITRIGTHDLTVGRPNLSQLFAELSQKSSANVTLIRGGQTLNVKVGQ